jgi:mannosyl-oligosaccharide alpha-1,3-glucosidase
MSLNDDVDQTYYDYFDYTIFKGRGSHIISAPLDKAPILVRGGSIIPRKDRPRGSSGRMTKDPYTLFITLSDEVSISISKLIQGTAEGELYVDDGESYDYTSGAYIHRKFTLSGKSLVSSNLGTRGKLSSSYLKSMQDIRVERIILVGIPKKFTGSTVKVIQSGKEWDTTVLKSKSLSGKARSIIIRDPKVRIGEDWEIQF